MRLRAALTTTAKSQTRETVSNKWSVLACLLGVIATSTQADTPAVVTDSAAYVPESNYNESKPEPLTAGVEVIERIIYTFADQPPDMQWKMVVLAYCESTEWIHRLPNGELRPHDDDKSSARGVFQVLVGLHREELERLELDPEDDEHYFKFVRVLFDRRGLKPWRSSFSCLHDERGSRARATAKHLLAEAAGEFQLVNVPLPQERLTARR